MNGDSSSQSQFVGKLIFHIYPYDAKGHYLGMQSYEQQNKFVDAKEIKFYIANPKTANHQILIDQRYSVARYSPQ